MCQAHTHEVRVAHVSRHKPTSGPVMVCFSVAPLQCPDPTLGRQPAVRSVPAQTRLQPDLFSDCGFDILYLSE